MEDEGAVEAVVDHEADAADGGGVEGGHTPGDIAASDHGDELGERDEDGLPLVVGRVRVGLIGVAWVDDFSGIEGATVKHFAAVGAQAGGDVEDIAAAVGADAGGQALEGAEVPLFLVGADGAEAAAVGVGGAAEDHDAVADLAASGGAAAHDVVVDGAPFAGESVGARVRPVEVGEQECGRFGVVRGGRGGCVGGAGAGDEQGGERDGQGLEGGAHGSGFAERL